MTKKIVVVTFLWVKGLPEAQLELGARREGINCESHSHLTQILLLVLGTDLKKDVREKRARWGPF